MSDLTNEKIFHENSDLTGKLQQAETPKRGFEEAGFNYGYKGKDGEVVLKKMITDIETQNVNLKETRLKELETNEKLLCEYRSQLDELKKARQTESIATFAFKPWSLLLAALFYLAGLWITKSNVAASLNLPSMILVFHGAWSIVFFLLYKADALIVWISKHPVLYAVLNTLMVILFAISYLISIPRDLFYPLLFGVISVSALNAVLHFGSAELRLLDRQIKKKHTEIIELEELKISIYKGIWSLTKQIEETKTEALIKFHTGHIYGSSLKVNL